MNGQGYFLNKLLLGVFLLVMVSVGYAQYGSPIVNVTIPFNFNVGAQRFLAGQYDLKPLLQHTITLRNEQGRALTNINSISVESREMPNTTTLVFRRYGEHYFLSQIWVASNSIGREITKSPAEIEIAKVVGSAGELIALNVGLNRSRM
jgi:hypothetical protein